MERGKIVEKLNSLFNEEQWGRIEPKDIGISKFKILDDLFNSIVSEGLLQEVLTICKEHIDNYSESITASYLIGLIGHHIDQIEDTVQLRKLIDIFIRNHKWIVVERIAEKVLEYGENSVALKALATSLERMGRNREAIPVLESLLKIDRFDADVAKKLAFAIIEDDSEKSIQYMKLSIEGFIKSGNYEEITELWSKLISVSWEDIQFFERIERMLIEASQTEMVSSLLKLLMHKYMEQENIDQSIDLLRKILEYTPNDNVARNELIKCYEKKYGEHSQYQQFLKISKLNNFKYSVKHAIQNFEKNIVFDKANYVIHRSWGIGKITDIDSEYITIDFQDKTDHRMSIQMSLQSLTPVNKDHIYVMEYEDFGTIEAIFKEDFRHFFELLIKSYEGTITLADIKKELIPKYIDAKGWSKWWSKTRVELKKDPHFHFSEKRKDLIIMRDRPVTFAEELLNIFTKAESFSEKLDVAIEFINNIEIEDGASVSQYFIDYYTDEGKDGSPTKRILSYFVLRGLSRYIDPKKIKIDAIREKVVHFIKESNEIPLISLKINSYDYKKDLVNLIEDVREDWPNIVSEILFETPVRIHKYIFNNLIRAHEYNIINNFIDRVITGAKQYPDIFIWVAKNILTKSWDYDWLDFSKDRMILTFFRLLNELKKIETKGNRRKNMMIDILYDNECTVLIDIVDQNEESFISKIYDLFSSVTYIDETHIEKFYAIIKNKYPEFQVKTHLQVAEDWDIDVEKLIVSQEGYDRMRAELNRMVNVEMASLSKELAKVSDVSGDIKENVEYNALMEKQAILKMAINKLEDELKKAEILNIDNISRDVVDIGANVICEDIKTGERDSYILLGPWDADYEKKILSYRSPIAKVLLGKGIGEEIDMKIGDDERRLRISAIERYTEIG
ncbi:MAG: transcription elongation factor GreA [Spirochaetota bacterium]|nr:transcription elongation factor GreA [Spirochaetota bacterium]